MTEEEKAAKKAKLSHKLNYRRDRRGFTENTQAIKDALNGQ